MTRYYHVTTSEYQDGEALYCYDELSEMGCTPAWKWELDADGEPDYVDTDVVCLFADLEAAREFQANFLPEGVILAVDLPEYAHELGIRMTTVDEGYPAVYGHIPAEYISRV